MRSGKFSTLLALGVCFGTGSCNEGNLSSAQKTESIVSESLEAKANRIASTVSISKDRVAHCNVSIKYMSRVNVLKGDAGLVDEGTLAVDDLSLVFWDRKLQDTVGAKELFFDLRGSANIPPINLVEARTKSHEMMYFSCLTDLASYVKRAEAM